MICSAIKLAYNSYEKFSFSSRPKSRVTCSCLGHRGTAAAHPFFHLKFGEQGWCGGTWHHMWVEFVVGSLPCSERFFSGYSGFPLSSKTNISKFQFDLDDCQAIYHEPLAWVIAQALPVFDIYIYIYIL